MLNNINYKMAIYKDCTLVEVLSVAVTNLALLIIILSSISKLLIGYLWPGYILASALFFIVNKFALSKLQKMKVGKPHGFYRHLIIRKLVDLGMIQSQYVTRIGTWSTRRKIDE
jgi:conjugative transfer region protein (TIGR03750 family)